MVFFRGQKKVGPRPDWSHLGVLIQNVRRATVPPLYGEPCPPPPPPPSPGAEHFCVYVVASQLEGSCNNDKYWVRVLHTLSQFPSMRLVDFSMLSKVDVEPNTTLE